jgi:hypothetical protein
MQCADRLLCYLMKCFELDTESPDSAEAEAEADEGDAKRAAAELLAEAGGGDDPEDSDAEPSDKDKAGAAAKGSKTSPAATTRQLPPVDGKTALGSLRKPMSRLICDVLTRLLLIHSVPRAASVPQGVRQDSAGPVHLGTAASRRRARRIRANGEPFGLRRLC